jgi:hypothetical protein
MRIGTPPIVMPGLDPGIHQNEKLSSAMDCRQSLSRGQTQSCGHSFPGSRSL